MHLGAGAKEIGMTITTCCEELRKLVEKNQVMILNNRIHIYGEPHFDDDGGGHYDDATDFFEIKFCPFCGSKQ